MMRGLAGWSALGAELTEELLHRDGRSVCAVARAIVIAVALALGGGLFSTVGVVVLASSGESPTHELPYAGTDWGRKFSTDLYRVVLEEMGEAPLGEGHHSGSIEYRFVWLPSFDDCVAIRVSAGPDTPMLAVRVLRGFQPVSADEQGNLVEYQPGSLVHTEDRALLPSEWNRFSQQIAESPFWEMAPAGEIGGVDGSEWILEGVSAGKHHIVIRWSPKSGAVRDLGLAFLELAGRDFGVPSENFIRVDAGEDPGATGRD